TVVETEAMPHENVTTVLAALQCAPALAFLISSSVTTGPPPGNASRKRYHRSRRLAMRACSWPPRGSVAVFVRQDNRRQLLEIDRLGIVPERDRVGRHVLIIAVFLDLAHLDGLPGRVVALPRIIVEPAHHVDTLVAFFLRLRDLPRQSVGVG